MRHEPHILPGVAFHEAGLLVRQRVEALDPVTIFIFRAEEASLGVEEIFVEHAATIEPFVVFSLAKFFGHQGHASVIKALLHSDADALVLKGLRQITISFPNLKRRVVVTAGAALHHGLISLLHIDARNLCQDGVGKHGDGVVTNHTVVVLSPEVPDGQVAVGLVV